MSKMVVKDDGANDRYGNHPIVFKGASVGQINEWLFRNYQGFKFAIVFDETKEEYEEMKDIYVYFMDEVLEEAAEYSGKRIVSDDTEECEDQSGE